MITGLIVNKTYLSEYRRRGTVIGIQVCVCVCVRERERERERDRERVRGFSVVLSPVTKTPVYVEECGVEADQWEEKVTSLNPGQSSVCFSLSNKLGFNMGWFRLA